LDPEDGSYILVDVTLIRLDTRFAPQGEFPVYYNSIYSDGTPRPVGYDAIVCVERYTPYIVQVYNTTSGARTTKLLDQKSSVLTDINGFNNYASKSSNVPDKLVITGKYKSFLVAAQNTINNIYEVSTLHCT
jgi:hypothetical protein